MTQEGLSFLQDLTEAQLVELVVLPLLSAMGYKDAVRKRRQGITQRLNGYEILGKVSPGTFPLLDHAKSSRPLLCFLVVGNNTREGQKSYHLLIEVA
jgi:hypothetical protein